MNKEQKKLSARQLGLIDDIFSGKGDEQQVLKKNKVNRNLYNKWLADEAFIAEIERRISSSALFSRAVVAGYVAGASARLVALTDSKNPETARKACLDVISLPTAKTEMDDGRKTMDADSAADDQQQISPATAERLLAALAEPKTGDG
jgi:uncharacterized protein (UPF0264 family)